MSIMLDSEIIAGQTEGRLSSFILQKSVQRDNGQLKSGLHWMQSITEFA